MTEMRYRVPHILEFVDGFRYEVKCELPSGSDWIEVTHKNDTHSLAEIQRAIDKGKIRVVDTIRSAFNETTIPTKSGDATVHPSGKCTFCTKEFTMTLSATETRMLASVLNTYFKSIGDRRVFDV